jgi:20S proteasome subunit beta 3
LQERDIKPAAFGKLVSSLLYEKRFGPYFIEPVIAGLGEVLIQYGFTRRVSNNIRNQDNKPYLFASDFIGAPLVPDMDTNGFVVAGTCTEQLFGMCESMWRPGKVDSPFFCENCLLDECLTGMEPEELFETISQCLLAGWNYIVDWLLCSCLA